MVWDFELLKVAEFAEDYEGWPEELRSASTTLGPGVEYESLWHRLKRKGVNQQDIDFVRRVLDPDPETRMTPMDVISTGYLETPLS